MPKDKDSPISQSLAVLAHALSRAQYDKDGNEFHCYNLDFDKPMNEAPIENFCYKCGEKYTETFSYCKGEKPDV